MLETFRKLFKDSSIYALGDFLTKGVGFLLLPLYTAYMVPEEYGIFSISISMASVFGIIATLGLKSSALKFYFSFDNSEEREKFYGSVWLVYMLLPTLIIIFLEFYGAQLFEYLLPSISYDPYIRLAFWSVYLTVVFYDFPMQIFISKGEANKYSILNICVFTLSTVLTIWFVVFKLEGVFGMLYAKHLGRLIFSILGIIYLYKFIRINLRLEYVKKALLYSLPLIPHFLSHWILNFSDRLVLEYFLPLSDVGIYNVGYTIGTALSIIVIAGNNSLIPLYGKLNLESQEKLKNLISLTSYYIIIIISCGLLILLCSRIFVIDFIDTEYSNSLKIIPWVVLGFIFMSFYFTQINLLTITLGKTRLIGIATTFAAICNLVLNILFIPIYGIIGAAFTTAVTYLILFIGIYLLSKREFNLKLEYFRFFKVFTCSMSIFLLYLLTDYKSIYFDILYILLFMVLYLILLFITNSITKKEILKLKKYIIR